MASKVDLYKCEKVAPEGGWGFMVALALALMFTFTILTYTGFGLVFGQFLRDHGDEISSTTIIHSVWATVFCLMGLVTNQLLTNYSIRKVGIWGSLIYFIGAFSTIFVESIPQMIFTFGVLQGIGYGLMTPVVFTAFNQYFVKKRGLINSIAQTVISAIGIAFPVSLQFCMDTFGYRGTVAILAALSLHTLFGMVLLQPVEWHMVDKITSNNSPNLNVKNNFSRRCSLAIVPPTELSPQTRRKTPEDSRVSVIFNEEKTETEKKSEDTNHSIVKKVVEFLDLGLLKNLEFVNLIVGAACGFISDLCFINLSPVFLLNRDFTPSETAVTITFVIAGDLVSRIIMIFFNIFFQVPNRYLVFMGMFIITILRFVFISTSNHLAIQIVIVGLGLTRCWFHVPLALAITEFNQEKFPAAYGLYMIACSIVSIILGILIGLLSAFVEGDTMTIVILGLINAVCSILWIIEFVIKFLRNLKTNSIKIRTLNTTFGNSKSSTR